MDPNLVSLVVTKNKTKFAPKVSQPRRRVNPPTPTPTPLPVVSDTQEPPSATVQDPVPEEEPRVEHHESVSTATVGSNRSNDSNDLPPPIVSGHAISLSMSIPSRPPSPPPSTPADQSELVVFQEQSSFAQAPPLSLSLTGSQLMVSKKKKTEDSKLLGKRSAQNVDLPKGVKLPKTKIPRPNLDAEGLAPPDVNAISVQVLCSSDYRFIGGRPMTKPSKDASRRRSSVVPSMTIVNESIPLPPSSLTSAARPGDEKQETSREADIKLAEETSSYSGPRVRVVDGQIVVDQASLVVQHDPVQQAQSMERVEETHGSRHITAGSFMRRDAGSKWTQEETQRFYEGLRCWGTDFEVIHRVLFPKRSRHQVKLKYNREERSNPAMIDRALRERRPLAEVSQLMKQMQKVEASS